MPHSIRNLSTSWLLLSAWSHHAVLVTNASSFRFANVNSPTSTGIGLRTSVAFLSPTDHRHRRSINHPRTPSRRVLSKSTANNGDDEQISNSIDHQECNLNRIYQQVQQDDADWYYSTLSKFLGDGALVGDASYVLDGDEDEQGVRKKDSGDDESANFDHRTQPHDKEMPGHTPDKTDRPLPTATLKDDTLRDDAQPRLHPTQAMGNHKTLTNRIIHDAEYDHENNDGHNNDGYNPNEDRHDAAYRRSQNKKLDTLEKPSSPEQERKSSQIVRLRNKFTNQCETIAELSKFSKMGYSQSDVVLLRPRVLELIVEDSIPKPRRGMPDRWLRDVYEDLDDEDVDWEVEVVDDDSTLLKQEANGIDHQDKVQTSRKDDSSYRSDTLREKEEVKRPISRSSDENVSESWGPFSSSRLVVDQREETTSKVNNNGQKEIDVKGNRGYTGLREEVNDGPTTYRRSPDRQPRSEPTLNDNDVVAPRREGKRVSSPSRRSYYDEEENEMYQKPNRPQQPPRSREAHRRQPRPRRRRELVIDRDDDDNGNDPPTNKFWMDLPTFRDFLRTEARLRLKILGPDWKESVLDESRWRFDLYKRWLFLLNDGVGENPLYTYSDRPRQPPPRRPRSSRGEKSYEASAVRERPTRTRQSRSDNVARGREPYSKTEDDELLPDTREGRLRQDRREELSGERGGRQSGSDENENERVRHKETARDESPREYGEIRRRPARRDDVGDQGRRSVIENDRERARYREVEDRELLEPSGDSEARRDDWQNRRPSSYRPPSSRREQPELKNFNDLEQYLQRSRESVSNGQRDDYDDAPRRRSRSSRDLLNEK